jgi:mono/diheme cytochrome c family protein
MRYFQSLLIGFLLATGSVCAASPATPAAPTFYRDIAPIVYQNCSSCHRPGESAPFSLLNYQDVKKHAFQIAAVTKSRFMPPWLPEAGHVEFEEERRLTASQIQLIQSWVQHGTLAGKAEDGPAPPVFQSEWALGKPDMILRVKQPYKLAAEGPEVFLELRPARSRQHNPLGESHGSASRQCQSVSPRQRHY